MCGIVGFAGHRLEEEKLRRAVRSLHHRGPDGSGVYIDSVEAAGLGHARLSIIDLKTGAQPLFASGGDLVLVCNGEIYDFERLRGELIERGYKFYTKSDSEVILHLYSEYGLDFVHSLRGEFAFLLLDKVNRRLIAVRDRFGIKPLFFHEQNGNFVFASEAKAIFATGCHQPKIDVVAVRDFLSSVIPDSVFEGIQVVPPGSIMSVDLENGKHSTHCYWDLDLPTEEELEDTEGSGFEEYIQTVRESLDEAVKLRLRSDVPVGVYLSGGIDSSVVAASVARQHKGPLKAFTIAFPDDENFNEFQLAKGMAEKIGAEFHSVRCDHRTMLESVGDCMWVSELPFHNLHGVGKFLLSRLAREHVKVVLTGEGADEVYLGYVCFQQGKGAITDQLENRLKEKEIRSKPHIKEIIKRIGFLPLQEHAELFSERHQRVMNSLFHPARRWKVVGTHPLSRLGQRVEHGPNGGSSFARKIQYFWIKSMLGPYILTILGDRQEMGHSIEGRTPFLDHHLFERVREIPDRYKIRNGVEKFVLREAFKGRITDEVYRGRKWPYSAPPLWVKKGIHAELDRLIDRCLSREAIERAGIFDYRKVRRWERIRRLLIIDCKLKRRLNELFTLILTVQMLDELFVQNFSANLDKRIQRQAENDCETGTDGLGSTEIDRQAMAV